LFGNRPHRPCGRRGNRGDAEAVKVAQAEDKPLVLGEPSYHAEQMLAFNPGGIERIVAAARLGTLRRQADRYAPRTQRIDHLVSGNLHQPRSESAGIRQRCQLLVRPEKRRLHNVFGRMEIVHAGQCQRQNATFITRDKRGERVPITAPNAGHNLCVRRHQ
jgi:hypothetical protein